MYRSCITTPPLHKVCWPTVALDTHCQTNADESHDVRPLSLFRFLSAACQIQQEKSRLRQPCPDRTGPESVSLHAFSELHQSRLQWLVMLRKPLVDGSTCVNRPPHLCFLMG